MSPSAISISWIVLVASCTHAHRHRACASVANSSINAAPAICCCCSEASGALPASRSLRKPLAAVSAAALGSTSRDGSARRMSSSVCRVPSSRTSMVDMADGARAPKRDQRIARRTWQAKLDVGLRQEGSQAPSTSLNHARRTSPGHLRPRLVLRGIPRLPRAPPAQPGGVRIAFTVVAALAGRRDLATEAAAHSRA